jgi:hypothetical protein
LGGLVVFGLIVADFLAHPAGTKAVSNAAVSLATPSIQGLAGQAIGSPKLQ